VHNNLFNAQTSEVQNDLLAIGGIKRFLAYNNVHASGTPALGGANVSYLFSATSSGMISNCWFGAEGTTDTGFMTLNGILQSGNHSSDALIVT
jgi:hypothetical protein